MKCLSSVNISYVVEVVVFFSFDLLEMYPYSIVYFSFFFVHIFFFNWCVESLEAVYTIQAPYGIVFNFFSKSDLTLMSIQMVNSIIKFTYIQAIKLSDSFHNISVHMTNAIFSTIHLVLLEQTRFQHKERKMPIIKRYRCVCVWDIQRMLNTFRHLFGVQ